MPDNANLSPLVIVGSRTITDYQILLSVLSKVTDSPTIGQFEVVTGDANGVDALARRWAEKNDCDITVFEAQWDTLGRGAGPARNEEMAGYAAPDGTVVALWDGESSGTRDMIDRALENGLETHVSVVT